MSHLVPINSISDLRMLAEDVAKSNLFGVQSTSEAMALMLVAQAEGLHPATAIQEFDIIQGKPARKTTALLARFQEMGGKVTWKVHTDEKVVGIFEYKGTTLEVAWDMARAKATQYWNTKNKAFEPLASKFNWKNYPRQMLRARVIAEGIRAVCPRAIGGMMVVEEAQDDIGPPSDVIDVTPVAKPAPKDVWTEELKVEALAAADEGTAAYNAWWKKQTQEFRDNAISSEDHAEFKAAAAKASAAKRAIAAQQPAQQETQS